jgi:DNA-binding NtrC family response regulator
MKRILIVDDEARMLSIYGRLLAAEGFQVIPAVNPDFANEVLKKERVDLILLDIKMPEAGGDALYEVINAFHGKTKVIVASVYPIDRQKRLIEGAVDYYDKSQGVDILLDKIEKALETQYT